MSKKEKIITIGWWSSIEQKALITRVVRNDKIQYFLFDKFKIFEKRQHV